MSGDVVEAAKAAHAMVRPEGTWAVNGCTEMYAVLPELVAEVERLRARAVEFPEPQKTSGWLSFPCYGNGVHVPPALPESRLDRHLILDETSGSGRVSVANARAHAAALLAAADAIEKRGQS